MKAVLSTCPGPPETLEFAEIAEPVAGVGEVVVAVRAVALNFFDTLIIEDRYQDKPPRPFAPGGECAGVVAEVGHGLTGFQPGDRVAAHIGWGGAQQKVAVPAGKLVKIPEALSFERAAALIMPTARPSTPCATARA
ncbi:MAG: alcohol dehydrogenase catalytic domain-containing protein [Blastochloris sp.]|nr:alcohol dehydrogenase catalytic domain-containing protein [Blastochloris sp.]